MDQEHTSMIVTLQRRWSSPPGFFKWGVGGSHTVSKWQYSPDCHVVFATCCRLFP